MNITIKQIQQLIDEAQKQSKGWQQSFSDEEWDFRKHRAKLWKIHRKISQEIEK